MAQNHDYLDKTRLVEEVPGVPENEQYYLRHNGKVIWRGPTAQAGRDWAASRGIEIEVFEPFEP